jgi:hypothetical protein
LLVSISSATWFAEGLMTPDRHEAKTLLEAMNDAME